MTGKETFVTARDVLAHAKVVPRTALRVVLPIAIRPECLDDLRTRLARSAGPWRLCKPPGTMVDYATRIADTWACWPAQLVHNRGKTLDVTLSSPKRSDVWRVPAVLSELRFASYRDSGIGFLIVTVSVVDERPLVDWLDLAAAIRFADARRGVAIRPRSAMAAPLPETVKGLMVAMAESLGLSVEVAGKSLFVKKQMLVSGTWFVEGADEGEELVRYAVRSQFSSRFLVGAGEEERTGRAGNRLAYALRQDFVSTLECTHYLGFDVPRDHPFFADTLPEHLDTDYFSAWLFALQQRYFLLGEIAKLAEEALADAARSAAERYDEIDKRAEALARFEARGYELQLYQIEHHHRYWDACRETLDIEALHGYMTGLLERAVARAEAKRIEEQGQREKWFERRIIAALALPGIAFGFAGINIQGWTAGADGASQHFALIMLGVNLLIVAGIVFLRPRVSKPPELSTPKAQLLAQTPALSKEEATEHG